MIENIFVSPGIHWLSFPEANLNVLCGCPADSVKHLMKKGLIRSIEKDGMTYESGPNAILLSDLKLQNGHFANLAEFPILQMLYRQGMLLPNHPNNTGVKPILIGREDCVQEQMNYIFRGNYGLISVEEMVQAGIEHLESHLKRILNTAEMSAAKDRVATIKPRHLKIIVSEPSAEVEIVESEPEEDLLEGQVSGSALTPMALRKMARSFAGMPITDAAVEELLLLYYDVVDETGHSIREHAQLGGNPSGFIESLDRMKDLMMLGWMRRMLKRAGVDAEERGYKRIDIEQLIHLDPFE